jgi:hypothetical protein
LYTKITSTILRERAKMTQTEYLRKREAYASSSADNETIQKAIQELDDIYIPNQDLLKEAMVEDSDPSEAIGD